MTTQAFTQTASFVLSGQRVSVTFKAEPVSEGERLTIDLKPRPADAMRYSFTGECAGGFGQCDGAIREAGVAAGASDVVRLCDLWDELHLNDLEAGTRAQITALEDMPVTPSGRTYDAKLGYLAERGLMVDMNDGATYKYGSAWLYRPVDPSRVVEARKILSRLDGARIGAAADSAEDFEEASFSNSDDVIDSRDVIARIEYLRDWIAAAEEGSDDLESAKEELATLEALESEAEDCASDWRYGETLIRDDYFEDYARQFAEDIGAVKDDVSWPYDCIDWEKAASQLQQDYTSVEFGGVTYWVR